MTFYNTLTPYKTIDYQGIQYTTCRNFDHISRYKGLRQVIHRPNTDNRFVSLETPNSFNTNLEFQYHYVTSNEVNRIDILAKNFYGSAHYGWIICYYNNIEDGFTIHEGQRLRIISNFSSLFNKGELLAAIPVSQLQLGTE